MIFLTKLDGEPMALDIDHIERVESHPDTVIYLTHGSRLLVKEPPEAVVEAVLEVKAEILRRAASPPRAGGGSSGEREHPPSAAGLRVVGSSEEPDQR